MPTKSSVLAARYVRWLVRRGRAIVAASMALVAVSVYLTAFHLPVRADFAHLLPDDAPSVRDLERLEARVASQDTALVIVRGEPGARAAAAAELAAALRALPPELVARVETDDAETRAFLRTHRHLLVPLDQLEAARDALAERIRAAKLAANPLYVDLDDDGGADADAARARLDELRAQRADAEARLERSGFVSADGTSQLLVVRTGFAKTEIERGQALHAALIAARADVVARHGVEVGLTGGVPAGVAEHDALVRGMVWSTAVTAGLVALVLVAYFRSVRLLGLLSIALASGTAVSFGVAALTVGRLNAATAFLGAIIAGNGINYGILLIARWLEERRGRDPEAAMAEAIDATLRPTIVASLGASIAYGSLAATSFRGFADFAVIGGAGMLLCWLASYVLLPALVLRWAAGTRVVTAPPRLGAWLARLLGFRRPGLVCAATAVVALGAGAVAYRYLADDPFEYDLTELRSSGADAREVRRWLEVSDATFGRGISGQTVIAADHPAQVPLIVEALRAHDAGARARTIGAVYSILDVVPADQDARLAVLAEIRALLDDDALAALDDAERAELAALRPPDALAPITADHLPEELAARLREKDGRVGLLVAVRAHDSLDPWDGRDLIRFAGAIRAVDLPTGETVTTSGGDVIFVDILQTIRGDGPRVIAVAGGALVLMVLLLVGRDRRGVAVLTATGLGSLLLVAVCALVGIRVTFLDFVALPITLGLGVDYAINVAERHHRGAAFDPAATLRTSGAAVLLCSLTTIIGYGSLLVSDNLAIRSFGLASLIGEVCCVLTALIVVPAIVGVRRRAPSLAEAVVVVR